MITIPDRIEDLLDQSRVTGIDFIYVDKFQTDIYVHFLRAPDTLEPSMTSGPDQLTDPGMIRIYNPAGDTPDKIVRNIGWSDNVLHLELESPGDFTLYKLYINDPRVAPFYNDVTFDFKANCPSDLDCKSPANDCPPDDWVDFPVDYLARDFNSFRQALLEFASNRYPHWPDRLEADAGVMLAELMSAMGDEMAYYQDRIAREAYLETATQRRSLRRHARMVDYTLHDGLGAMAWLNITTDTFGEIRPGTPVSAQGESGLSIVFEIGKNLEEQFLTTLHYKVDPALNELIPHIWDEDQSCLPVGSTEIYVEGHFADGGTPAVGKLSFNEPYDEPTGKWILLQTRPGNAAQPVRSFLVRVSAIENTTDPVFNTNITRLGWSQDYATAFEMDMSVLSICCNIIPATAGETRSACFITGKDPDNVFTAAQWTALHNLNNSLTPEYSLERRGRRIVLTDDASVDSIIHRYSLPGSEQQILVRAGDDPFTAKPEIYLEEMEFQGGEWKSNGRPWQYTPSFVGIDSADPEDRCFSLDDGTWRRIVGYQRPGKEIIHRDYATNNGVTIFFGDSEFGLTPKDNTVFRVHYRLGNGKWDNVSADVLKVVHVPALTLTVTNPLPAKNGMDLQTPEELRQLAPEAFRAVTYRAVRPEDYAEAAERLPWVQRAGAAFRWTGSWLSAFVTPDPKSTVLLAADKEQELLDHLNLFRQAGKEVNVMKPDYANIDIEIEICAASDAFSGEVKERILEVLLGRKGVFRKEGYFSADHFTFGTPLQRSTLEAIIQSVPGVRAVEEIIFRRRGWFDWKVFNTLEYAPGVNSIIRVENDRLNPGRGSLKINIHGGA